ncbi:MAG: ribonuclease J [Oscillospiraceae bacterium]|nr:ribonuclease J [Oscillospiraceae bacterium]
MANETNNAAVKNTAATNFDATNKTAASNKSTPNRAATTNTAAATNRATTKRATTHTAAATNKAATPNRSVPNNKATTANKAANNSTANNATGNNAVANTTNTKPNHQYNHRSQRRKTNPTSAQVKPLRIIPLGGLNEIGKNITLYEYGGDMFLVDCGMSFPDEEMPGIDIVLPDFSYVLKNADKIKGLVITHGHEDHIGGIPYLLKNFNVPIYATPLAIGLISGKLKEHRLLAGAKLNIINAGDVITLGCFSIELIHVNHSIPDAVALAIRCPAGLVVETGDFKIDTTPVDGGMIDLARFAELGKEGVLALLSDSTNAERPGFTPSERIVGESFSNLFRKAEGKRIIVATFSSSIYRVQQIVDEAVRCGRKVAVSGRSMINVVSVATELGYLKIPDGVLIELELIKKYKNDQIVLITTGSQGEPMSALHRMAFSDHRQVEITPEDMIIISATPIPGNEKLVGKVINELLKLGAEVVYEKMYDVHVSGHACQEELKMMLSLVKPKFFIPVHGEQKHLVKHAKLGELLGIPHGNILITDIGSVIELTKNSMKVVEVVPAGRVLVDGLGVGDVGSIVLRDRKHLAEDGIIVVVITMDSSVGEVVAGPDVISRGFVYVKESEQLLDDAREVACKVIEQCYVTNIREWNAIKTKVRDAISKFLYEKTRRSPMILPIIMEI